MFFPLPRVRCGENAGGGVSRPMAVYTDVSDEDLARFLAGYDLGELLSYKGIAEGVENSNFLVHTSSRLFHPDALREARRRGATCRSSSA